MKKYLVIGNPVSHSLSPRLHNYWLKQNNIDAIYDKTKLEEDGNNYVGRAKILSTPNGQIVRNLIDDGAKLGVSSRGLGSLEEKGGAQYVKNDFQLATAGDIVADPSAPEAFVNGIMEGTEWVYNNGILTAMQVEDMQNQIKTAKLNKLEETKLKLWKEFVENL